MKEIKASNLFLDGSLSNCDRKIINVNNFTSPPGIKTLVSRDSNFFLIFLRLVLSIFFGIYITEKNWHSLIRGIRASSSSNIHDRIQNMANNKVSGAVSRRVAGEIHWRGGPRRGSKTGLIKITEYARRGRTTNKRTAARVGERGGKNCHRAKPSTVR